MQQVVSETPGVPSVYFDAAEWAYKQVPPWTGAVGGFSDLRTIFYADVELPAEFGTPGDLLLDYTWGHRHGAAVDLHPCKP